MTQEPQVQVAVRMAIAALIGLRTFFLLGLLGGAAGLLAAESFVAIATAVALGGGALCVSAYVMAVRRARAMPDGTTEAAALVVIALGVLAGIGWLGVAAGAGAMVVLMLSEKARLHWLVRQLGEPELRAGLQFAVLAVVVLPLLPEGPYFGVLAVKPRALWAIVLLLSGLSFAGFLARRIVGASRGMGITGALGGVISSTAVTISFSRQSRNDAALAAPLARGVLAASTVLVPRVLVVSAAFDPAVALRLAPLVAPMFVAGLALVTLVGRSWGASGLYATAAVLGLTDVDALNVSMSRPAAGIRPDVAARAIAIGILVNTLFRTGVALALGRARYRRRAAGGLLGLAAAGALGLLLAM